MRITVIDFRRVLFFGAVVAGTLLYAPTVVAPAFGAVATPPASFGSPGFSPNGGGCARDGKTVVVFDRNGKVSDRRDFFTAARTAIERDILAKHGRWDGKAHWNTSSDQSIVFDEAGHAYTLINPRWGKLTFAVLLMSADQCRSWQAVRVSGRYATLERPDVRNDFSGPPTVLSFESAANPGARLWLDLFRVRNGRLQRANRPTIISHDSILVPNHSGGANSSFTTKDRVVIVYPTDDRSAPGTLAMVREFDRRTNKFTGPAKVIGRSLAVKPNVIADIHDIPGISMLPDGRLFVVMGAHNANFQTLTSKAKGTFAQGHTPLTPIAPRSDLGGGHLTYVSLNIARDGTINIFARDRYTRDGAVLIQMQKRPGKGWTQWNEGKYRVIAYPNRRGYMAYRQKVSLAPDGRLFLTWWPYANLLTQGEAKDAGILNGSKKNCAEGRCWYNEAPTGKPRTLVSDDNGDTWHPVR